MSSFSLDFSKSKLLILQESDFIGKGNERACYTNPLNKNLCVKVQKRAHRSQNKIEKYYYEKLKTRKNLSPFISEFYGEVTTNMGDGLVFEKVTDDNGAASQSIYTLLKSKVISESEAKEILNTVFQDLYKNAILLGDVTKDQILLQKTEHGYTPKIIDGLGTRRYGLKLFLVSNIKSFARFKLISRWKTLESALNIA